MPFVPGEAWTNLVSGAISVSDATSVPNATYLSPAAGNDGLVGPADGVVIYLAGLVSKLDGGQGWFMWDAASTLAANGSTVFNPHVNTGLAGRWRATAPPSLQQLSPAANRLLNGTHQIDQANEGVSVSLATGVPLYIVDGWKASFVSAAAVVSASRVADGPLTFPNSVRMTVGTGSAVGAGDNAQILTVLEANTLTDLAYGTASARLMWLSFWVKCSIAPYTFSVAVRNAANTRSLILPLSVSTAGVWTQMFVPVLGDVAGAWVTSGNALGMTVAFVAATGATFQTGTPGQWVAGNFLGIALNTNTVLSTNAATFAIAAVKLEAGLAPSPFQQTDYALALEQCQRYFEKSYTDGVAIGTVTTLGAARRVQETTSNIVFQLPITFKQTKRAAPTVQARSPGTGAADRILNSNGASDLAATYIDVGANGCTLQPAAVVGVVSATMSAHWTADARL